jgi:alpha-1,6-mannosyltransferase
MYRKDVITARLFETAGKSIAFSLVLTLIGDSLFWQELCWPELDALWHNLGQMFWTEQTEKVKPWYWYAYAILRILTGESLLLLALFTSNRFATFKKFEIVIIPTAWFILLYSLHPVKEMRYMYPIIPGLSILAAEGFRK